MMNSNAVDPIVEKACDEYLKSKGFSDIYLKTYQPYRRLLSNSDLSYAFTVPEINSKTIFLTGRMEATIKKDLENNQSIAIYDRFTLLHELGHLHPYGLEHKRLCETKDDRATMKAAYMGLILVASMAGAIIAKEFDNKACAEICAYAALASCFSMSIAPTVFTILDANIAESIQQKYQKHTFHHPDNEYEKYIKASCEEQDADHFAFALLADAELKELYEYYDNALSNNVQIGSSAEDDVHATDRETFINIGAEIDRRISS